MLALRVRVEVARETAADDLAVAIDAVLGIGDDDVPAGAAGDPVDAAVVLGGDPVGPAARRDRVGALAPGELVGSRRPEDARLEGRSRDGAAHEPGGEYEPEEAQAHGPERTGLRLSVC